MQLLLSPLLKILLFSLSHLDNSLALLLALLKSLLHDFSIPSVTFLSCSSLFLLSLSFIHKITGFPIGIRIWCHRYRSVSR
jgi:hypothetical protein